MHNAIVAVRPKSNQEQNLESSPPEDFDRWAEHEAEQQQAQAAPIQQGNQGTEQEWLQWFNKSALESLPNPLLIAPPIASKSTAPGTPEQHSAYIHEFSDENAKLTAYVRAVRYRAVHSVWADGSKSGPKLPDGTSAEVAQWLHGQMQITKYLKWFRKTDPAGYATFLESHPSFQSQTAQVPEESLQNRLLREQREIDQLFHERRKLRAWFLTGNEKASHVEWQQNFLRLRELEEALTTKFGARGESSSRLETGPERTRRIRIKRMSRKCSPSARITEPQEQSAPRMAVAE